MPRKKRRLSLETRQRLDRLLERRPRAVPVPDPSERRFREWVIGLTQDDMHKEICSRLAKRWTLIRNALMSWPHEYLGDEKARFPSIVQFLERFTIDDPVIQLGGDRLSFLELEQLLAMRNPEGPPDAIELTYQAFEKRFFREWLFRARPFEGCSLEEYDKLLRALRDLKRAGPKRRNPFGALLTQRHTLELAGQEYKVPADWKHRVRSTAPPTDVAMVLLTRRWGGNNPQAVKEHLVRLRTEAPIALAWTSYDKHLSDDPSRLREIYFAVCRERRLLAWPPSWPTPDFTPAP